MIAPMATEFTKQWLSITDKQRPLVQPFSHVRGELDDRDRFSYMARA